MTDELLRGAAPASASCSREDALFDSLTVAENAGFGLADRADVTEEQLAARVDEVLGFVGLRDYKDRLPSELSGGQRRRGGDRPGDGAGAGLLRRPDAGLDPLIATTVDGEIVKLRDLEHVTSFVATHQIRDAFYIATHRAMRQDGRVEIVAAGAGAPPLAEFVLLRDGEIKFTGSAGGDPGVARPCGKEYCSRRCRPGDGPCRQAGGGSARSDWRRTTIGHERGQASTKAWLQSCALASLRWLLSAVEARISVTSGTASSSAKRDGPAPASAQDSSTA
ncbi:MAG: hypothetical protein R2708_25135 [Vicinamibacterales bacterium]